jgi:hypothetical protein
MVINATFNNISVITWQSVLLLEETGVLGENHWPVTSHWQTWSHNVVSSTPRHERGSNSQLSGDYQTNQQANNYFSVIIIIIIINSLFIEGYTVS